MSQQGWLTPNDIPGSKQARAICFPDGQDWQANLYGCLLLLAKPENHEQFGLLTPEETADEWMAVLLEFIEGGCSMVPTGTVLEFAGVVEPDGYLMCVGQAVSRVVYAALFAVIGTRFGPGDGTTTFNLPDRQGRVGVGWSATENEFNDVGNSGGEKTHTLTAEEMPVHTHIQNSHNHTQNSHNHTQNSHNHTQNSHSHVVGGILTAGSGTNRRQLTTALGTDNGWSSVETPTNIAATATNIAETATNIAATATNQNAGEGEPHNNVQPYLVFSYIIKT